MERLRAAISAAAQLLPVSGPITSYAFLNTLSALEDMSFAEGIERGAALYGCEPWLSEDAYRSHMAAGRIDAEDLGTVLYDSLGEGGEALVGSLCTRFDLRTAMLKHPLPWGPTVELRWFADENRSFFRFRRDASEEARKQMLDETRQRLMGEALAALSSSDAGNDAETQANAESSGYGYWSKSDSEVEAIGLKSLWQVCRDKTEGLEFPHAGPAAPIRLRDLLLEVTSDDSDALAQDLLIRFCAAFTDQGLASWPLPGKADGFYQAFFQLYRHHAGPPHQWTRDLPAEIVRLSGCDMQPLESIRESLIMLGYTEDEWPDAVQATVLALRGWAGLLWHMEVRPDRFGSPVPPGTLLEFIAVHLLLERLAIEHLIQRTEFEVRQLNQLRDMLLAAREKRPHGTDLRLAFTVFQLAQIMGWSPERLARLSEADWTALVNEIANFGQLERRRLLHRAYERHFQCQALDALWTYCQRRPAGCRRPIFKP